MSISTLIELIGTPENPVDTGDTDRWVNVERELGTALPDDYKLFISTYGTGLLFNFIRINNVFSAESNQNLEAVLSLLKYLRDDRERGYGLSESKVYSIFPEPGGLLPVGSTMNGDWIFWKTQGDPNDWTIVLHAVRSYDNEEHEMGLSSFFVNLINGEIEGSWFSPLVERVPFEVYD